MSNTEEFITFKCFNTNQPAQIPLSSIVLDAWNLKDTSIANLIKHGTREFFIHTDNLMPLMFFIHKAKNPGRKLLKEIAAQQDILDMDKYGVLDVCSTAIDLDKFKPNYIVSTDENKEIFKRMIYDQYKDQLKNEYDGLIDNSYDNFKLYSGQFIWKYTFSKVSDINELDTDISEHILYQMEKDIMEKRNITPISINYILNKYYPEMLNKDKK